MVLLDMALALSNFSGREFELCVRGAGGVSDEAGERIGGLCGARNRRHPGMDPGEAAPQVAAVSFFSYEGVESLRSRILPKQWSRARVLALRYVVTRGRDGVGGAALRDANAGEEALMAFAEHQRETADGLRVRVPHQSLFSG